MRGIGWLVNTKVFEKSRPLLELMIIVCIELENF